MNRLNPLLDVTFDSRLLLAGMIFTVGAAVAIAGVVSFRNANTTVDPTAPEKTSAVVTSGVYRLSRNPMYLGFLLWLVAGAMVLGDFLAGLLLPGFVIYMNRFQILPEERALLEKFGADFSAYKQSVRRWI